jgi:glycosyltransferase involved in cell wall biosynthesis
MTRVVHVGNDAEGLGGIASVIRSHLGRELNGYSIEAITSYRPGASSGQALSMWLNSVSKIWALDKGCIVHVHMSQKGSVVREGSLLILARTRGFKTVVTLHGSRILASGKVQTWVMSRVLKFSSIVHGFSEKYRSKLHISPSRWALIPNDIPDSAILAPHPRPTLTVLFLGEVGLRKGIDTVANAWTNVHDAHLIVAGDVTKEGEEFTQKLASLGSVKIAGHVAPSQVREMLTSTSILIQPSRAEAFPMAVCEAMGAGCAVVGTDVGGLGDLLTSAGQIVFDGSAEGLADSVNRLVEDPALLADLQDRARVYALENLTTSVVNETWLRTYSSLV